MSVNSSNSSYETPKSSAISNPRTRRFIWYENKLTDVAEIGLYFEAKFIFTKFDHDGGYDCGIVENMQEHITKKWPKLELLHSKLSLLKFYFEEVPVDAKTEDEFLNDFLKLNKLISCFARKYNRPGDAKIGEVYQCITEIALLEIDLLNRLTRSKHRPNRKVWSRFVERIHFINYWCMHLDICSDFNMELGRNGLKTKFTDIIFARIECLMCMWLNDHQLIEFNSVVKIVEFSDDFCGQEVFPPFDMEHATVLPGGVSTETNIGLIQADQFEIKIGIRFDTKNMISAKNYDGKPYPKPWAIRPPPNSVTSACKHIDQVHQKTVLTIITSLLRRKSLQTICSQQ